VKAALKCSLQTGDDIIEPWSKLLHSLSPHHPVNAATMNSIRHAARRPVFRCLNTPAPLRSNPQFRQNTRSSRADLEAILKQGARPKVPRPDEDFVSVHRAEAMRRAQLIKKRNWLALGAALSMIAPIFLVRLWDVPPLEEKGEEPRRGIVEKIMGPPIQNDAPRKAAAEYWPPSGVSYRVHGGCIDRVMW
jgi:hypothetical protein